MGERNYLKQCVFCVCVCVQGHTACEWPSTCLSFLDVIVLYAV